MLYATVRSLDAAHLSHPASPFELKEALDVPDNTVCYVDDVSLRHSWYPLGAEAGRFRRGGKNNDNNNSSHNYRHVLI